MPAPVILPTVTGVARSAAHWAFQVDTSSSTTVPTWVTVFGLTNFNPAKSDNMVDTTDYDAVGWSATQPFLSGFTVTGSVERKLYSGALDVGQEFLRSQNYAKLTVHARWFDRTGAAEAFDGWGFTTWENQGGDPNTADIVNFTLSGNGALTAITNPFATLVVATVGSATPSGASVGQIVRITGSGFTGATSTKFGAVTATITDIVSDNLIEAVMPAGSAGSAPVTVVNVTGTSNALAYTRGA
jgi:hypothetical protein